MGDTVHGGNGEERDVAAYYVEAELPVGIRLSTPGHTRVYLVFVLADLVKQQDVAPDILLSSYGEGLSNKDDEYDNSANTHITANLLIIIVTSARRNKKIPIFFEMGMIIL